MNLPEKIYSEQELTKAKNSAQIVGWLQGAGVMFGGVVLWNLLGWIPIVAGVAAAGWVIYKLMGRSKKGDEE